MKKRILVLVIGLWTSLGFIACGGGGPKQPPSGLKNRVLASQGVSARVALGSLVMVNGENDTLPRVAPLPAGISPGLMAISPSRNVVAAFDTGTNSVYADNTTTEKAIGNGVHLPGPTQSLLVPTSSPIAYAAVPSATVNGFAFQGAVDVMNFTTGSLLTIAVNGAQTIASNSGGTQLLVFSSDSNSMTVLTPGVAAPPVDLSCSNPPNAVCTVVPGFDRPVNAIINETTAYVLNCGPECGGTQASVMIFDLGSLTITDMIPVDAATMAFLDGTTLYVAGTSPTKNACTGETTAAKTCGRLDVIDLNSRAVTASYVITDGYHWRMDMSVNGQLFIGSYDCTNIGNVNVGTGEIRGCLTILNTTNNAIIIPGDNGDVGGLQSFTTRDIEYVAEGGNLRVYTTDTDGLLINDFLPFGTIDIVGYVGDVKAIDFF